MFPVRNSLVYLQTQESEGNHEGEPKMENTRRGTKPKQEKHYTKRKTQQTKQEERKQRQHKLHEVEKHTTKSRLKHNPHGDEQNQYQHTRGKKGSTYEIKRRNTTNEKRHKGKQLRRGNITKSGGKHRKEQIQPRAKETSKFFLKRCRQDKT